jgi:protein gp37
VAAETGIEWCDSTFNPWIGCTRVSPACDDCYAARSTPARAMGIAWGAGESRRRTAAATWRAPVRWNADGGEFYAAHGRRRRVFCASLADVFDNEIDPAWRADLFRLIGSTPNLDWLILTKRIGNVAKMMREIHLDWPRNAALGFTAVNQDEINRDWRKAQSAAYGLKPLFLFVSIEPMLGPVSLAHVESQSDDWTYYDNALTGSSPTKCGAWDGPRLDWVICGGESGPKARPMRGAWARSLRDQCDAAGVPFLFKQWGEWSGPGLSFPDGHPEQIEPDDDAIFKVGKKAAGRELDGRTHTEFPAPAARA